MSLIEALFGGLPFAVQVFFLIVLLVDVASLVGVIVLLIAAARFRARTRQAPPGDEARFLWVFLVPALNEEVTIADSVERLRRTRATNALFVIIDDGSEDRTGEILAGIDDPRLRVLTRVAPDARQGKAAALNAAYRTVRASLTNDAELSRWSEDQVIVTIVDADGRLDPAAPEHVAKHFSAPEVGGVQVLVRIYNRRGPLTWAQDVEFSSFGLVFQAGRSWWGVANMGGNGQFNRLSALATIDVDAGPWRDRLTEDQDLGVRLIQSGWTGVHENGTSIDQQGLNSLRRLYRQRTRWAQGNWQAMALLRGTFRARLPVFGLIDTVFYLLTPALQLLTGVAFVVSIVLAVVAGTEFTPAVWWVLIFFLGVSFGGGIATLTIRGGRWYSPFVAIVELIPYTIYSWLTFPVLMISLARLMSGRTSWTKTPREQLDAAPADG